jgi:hypothetical protein
MKTLPSTVASPLTLASFAAQADEVVCPKLRERGDGDITRKCNGRISCRWSSTR